MWIVDVRETIKSLVVRFGNSSDLAASKICSKIQLLISMQNFIVRVEFFSALDEDQGQEKEIPSIVIYTSTVQYTDVGKLYVSKQY